MTYHYNGDWEGDHIEVVQEDVENGSYVRLSVREREAHFLELMETEDSEVFGSVVLEEVQEAEDLIEALEEFVEAAE